MDEYDLRSEELDTIKAIYEDLSIIDTSTQSGTVLVPIVLDGEISVRLEVADPKVSLSTKVAFLPPVSFTFVLPEKYPYEAPPDIEIQSVVLAADTVSQIGADLAQMWYEMKDQVLFSMIDFIQQKTHEYADEISDKTIFCNKQELYEKLRAYDQEKRLDSFNGSTFNCEICQRDLKGDKCVKFSDCNHVFCRVCLRDFFVSLIDSGDVEKVHCPDFQCGKDVLQVREKYLRLDFLGGDNFDFEEFKHKIMTPPIKPDVVHGILGTDAEGTALYEKYSTIYTDHQHALIAKLFPMRLVSCPRPHCSSMIFRENTQDRLVVCRQCGYAFCNTCRKSFHSSSIDCSRKRDDTIYHGIAVEDIELWIAEGKSTPAGNELRCRYGHELLRKVADEYTMDQMFNEMLREESHEFSKCPTCDIVIQRSEGCNKMRCSHCYTFFCHLCSTFLDQDHPYDHFKDRASPCYNRLFQGMPGTEDLN
ncbi:hypothetical protein JCM33374_g4094 [Metschnikowia sp. JCM 33374]|nr:hypothetical protein JCM33374_g4094 [Metschnikowia sp. JCM 33374]